MDLLLPTVDRCGKGGRRMMKLKVIGLVLLWLGASVTPAVVKTLPQGVWKMDVYQNMYEIEKAV